jgi:hypothetical protein
VAIGDAVIPTFQCAFQASCESRLPMVSSTLKNRSKNCLIHSGRSFAAMSLIPSNTDMSTPSGLSSALTRYGATGLSSTPLRTRSELYWPR